MWRTMVEVELSDKEVKQTVFNYLDERRTKFNSTRVTIDELLSNTAIQKPAKANVLYREWLVKNAKEKLDNESSTKQASETTETQRQEESNPTEPTPTNAKEEPIEKRAEGTESSPDGVGNSTGKDA